MNNPFSSLAHIWIIDDDPSIRWILERALTNVGFKITTFETASKALLQFKRSHYTPALILTDFRMPGINGFELLKQIKNLDQTLPIIIMTAYSDLDTTIEAYQEGAFDYLSKPFDIDHAIALVRQAYRVTTDRKVNAEDKPSTNLNWETTLQQWANHVLAEGKNDILITAIEKFEKTLITCALSATKGHKQAAAKRLGWGRNTLTRKIKSYF